MNTKCRCGLMLLFALALSTALVAQQAAGAMRAAITSGPTIQDATDSSMVVVWKTQSPSPSYIYYGPDLARINQRAGSAATESSHQVHLSGLQANSPYYFQVSTPEGKSDIYSAFTVASSEAPTSNEPAAWYASGHKPQMSSNGSGTTR